MKSILVLLNLFFLVQAGAQSARSPVTTVPSVDLKQYLGVWYEIAAIPQSFQKQCIGNTTAEYALAENDLISVVNSCDTSSGERSVANGRAKVVDKNSKSKLKVTFVNFLGWQFLFGGDYWILALGENYSYAVVGAPGRDYAWILSRTPEMSAVHLKEATEVLFDQGFDTCKVLSSPQAGGFQERTPICKLVPGP